MSEIEKLMVAPPRHPPSDAMARSLLQVYPVGAGVLFLLPLMPLIVSLLSYIGWSVLPVAFTEIIHAVSPVTGFFTDRLAMPRVHPELTYLLQFVVGTDALLSVVAIGLLIVLQLRYRRHITPWMAYRFGATPGGYFRRFRGPWIALTLVAAALVLDLLFGSISLSIARGRGREFILAPATLLFNLGFGASILIGLNLMALLFPLTALLGTTTTKQPR
jgi:hypothetical protein